MLCTTPMMLRFTGSDRFLCLLGVHQRLVFLVSDGQLFVQGDDARLDSRALAARLLEEFLLGVEQLAVQVREL